MLRFANPQPASSVRLHILRSSRARTSPLRPRDRIGDETYAASTGLNIATDEEIDRCSLLPRKSSPERESPRRRAIDLGQFFLFYFTSLARVDENDRRLSSRQGRRSTSSLVSAVIAGGIWGSVGTEVGGKRKDDVSSSVRTFFPLMAGGTAPDAAARNPQSHPAVHHRHPTAPWFSTSAARGLQQGSSGASRGVLLYRSRPQPRDRSCRSGQTALASPGGPLFGGRRRMLEHRAVARIRPRERRRLSRSHVSSLRQMTSSEGPLCGCRHRYGADSSRDAVRRRRFGGMADACGSRPSRQFVYGRCARAVERA